MGVVIDIGLDPNGTPRFAWRPSSAPGALDVPTALLERWSRAREAYDRAETGWQEALGEIEAFLYAYRGEPAPVPLAAGVRDARHEQRNLARQPCMRGPRARDGSGPTGTCGRASGVNGVMPGARALE